MNRVQHTVLIIDDIIADRVAIRRALRGDVRSNARTDYRVHEVENAEQALAYLRKEQPDCLLLDYHLPDSDGLQLLQRIVEQARPHIYPVVMLTGASSTGLAVTAMQQGVHDFLPKDGLTAERLQQAIHNAIEKVNLLRQLEEQQEWFRLTLASIGDAVIATDQTGAVTFMNPVAEMLTGVTAGSSQGQPLVHLFRLLDENSGQPIANPIDQVLRTHQIIRSTTHVLLSGHHGMRLPIAYNAAPIQGRLGNLSGVVLTFRDVSAHKAAESALRESEARLRLGMSVAGVALAEVDYSTDTIVLSPEAAVLYDLPGIPARVARETVHNRFHPEDRLWLLPQIEQVLDPQGNGVMDLEHRIVLSNGAIRWLQVRKQVFFSQAGAGAPRPLRSLVAVVDITARKTAEERLRASEAHLNAILYHMPASVYILSTNHRYLLVNHRFEQENNITNAAIRGMSVYDRFPRAVADTLVANEQRVLRTKAPVSSEEVASRNGEIHYYASIKAPLLTDDGEPYALVGISLDITERKAAEALLERYQLLAQQTRDIILFIDADNGQLVEANQAAVAAYGYDHPTLLTQNVADLCAPHTRADVPTRIEQANNTGVLFETLHCRADGSTFPVEVSARGANIGDRRLILSIVRDITVRKAEEAVLRVSQQRLQMALEAAQMGVWEWNMADRAIHWSPEVYQINGVSSFDGTPAASNRTVYPTDLSSVQNKVAQAIQQRIPYSDEFRVLRPDGHIQWVATHGNVEYGPDGAPLCLRAVIQNVNARKRAELHQQFLLDLNAALNHLSDTDHIQQTVVERLGQYLAASHCFFNQIDLAADRATILATWSQPGELPVIDIYPVSAHVSPAYIANAQAGATLVADDLAHVERTKAPIPLWPQGNVQAIIRVPCLRQGEWVASLHVAHGTPRQWRPDEVQLVESVVQHFWPLVEKTRTEEALRRQEEFLRQIADNVPALVGYLGADERYRFVNTTFESWFQQRRQALIGSTVQQLLGEAERKRLAVYRERAFAGETVTYEDTFTYPDGITRRFWGRYQPDFAADGSVLGFYIFVMDISERKRAEERLQLSEEKFAKAFHHIPLILVISRIADGHIVEVNETFERVSGYQRHEVLGQTVTELGLFVEPTVPALFLGQLRSGQPLRNLEARIRLRDGSERIYMGSADRLVVNGEPCILSTFLDITERKEAEIRLHQSEERLRLALEGGGMGTWEWNPGLQQLTWSVQEYALFGLPVGTEITSERFDALIHPADLSALKEAMARLHQAGSEYSTEFRIVRPDGETHWLAERATVVRDADGHPIRIVGINFDITVRKQQEGILRQWSATLEQHVAERTRELEQKNIELERSNRELEKFAYVASHDLRSPLRAIDNLSKWVAEDSSHLLLDPSKEHLQKIRGRVQRMDKLLDDLLAYSRLGRFHYHVEAIDVGQMLQEILALLHIPATLQVTLAEGLPSLRTQRVPLEMVLRNLIGNAIKHHHRPDGHIHVTASEEDKWIHFAVSDDGPGIDPQFHTKIFEIFQTLKPRDTVEGSGMGLAIVKKIMEIAGGTITVESSVDAGATFHFTWPRTILESGVAKDQE